MYKKIILGILIILISLNISIAEEYIISEYLDISNTRSLSFYQNAQSTGNFGKYNFNYGEFSYWSVTVPIAKWQGSSDFSSYDSVELRLNSDVGTLLGHGTYGYTKSSDGQEVYVQLFVDDLDFGATTGLNNIYLVGYSGAAIKWGVSSVSYFSGNVEDDFLLVGLYSSTQYYQMGDYYIDRRFYFENKITYFDNISYYYLKIDKSVGNETKAKITQSNGYILLNEGSTNANDIYVINSTTSLFEWYLNINSVYDTWFNFSIAFREEASSTPFLITNKTNYLTNESILISWGNMLNLPLAYTPATLELQIKYTEGTKEYLKWNEILDYHEYNGSRIIDASFFIPQTNYTLYITDAEFPDIPLYHTTFNVKQTNDDYITTNKNYPPHQIYSGQTIQIYYQTQNTSKLNIVDDDNNLVSSYTVNGIGTKNYNIPTDITKSYSYPYWKIYLNDTVTSISLNQSIKVVWVSEPQITPTIPPTVQKTPDITSNDTTEILTELKNGTKPLIDLVYGIGFIFVDNPDYDSNDVVSIDEMNQWFNSLVKVGIFILLITFYYGFKREEQFRK